jgi:hypothetical protein
MNAPISQEPGDWIEWSGGECPLEDSVLVQVQFRDGTFSVEQPGSTAAYWDGRGSDGDTLTWVSQWAHIDHDSDIIAYRIVS